MSLATQALTAIELARDRHPANPEIQAAADSAEATLEPMGWRDTIRGGYFYSACVPYTAADASWYDRTVLYAYAGCDAWIARLQANMIPLAAALRTANDGAAAEVAEAVAESAQNQQEITEGVIGSPQDWWGALPKEIKVIAGIAGAWLVLDAWSKIR
tara:strand:- start:2136 stop:2609 length:474 start_codon:yes stop_codon:yes gene_type:complete